MKLLALSFLLVTAMLGCSKEPPVVVLDGWWNVDYAKNACQSAKAWYQENVKYITQLGCERITSCQEIMPTVEACGIDPSQDVRSFEDILAAEFASNSDCNSVQFVHFKSPNEVNKATSEAMKKKYWSLMLDYRPGSKNQHWSLVRLEPSAFTQGEGGPKEIAKKVCSIVKEQGATISN